jgi:hypothetical protein
VTTSAGAARVRSYRAISLSSVASSIKTARPEGKPS